MVVVVLGAKEHGKSNFVARVSHSQSDLLSELPKGKIGVDITCNNCFMRWTEEIGCGEPLLLPVRHYPMLHTFVRIIAPCLQFNNNNYIINFVHIHVSWGIQLVPPMAILWISISYSYYIALHIRVPPPNPNLRPPQNSEVKNQVLSPHVIVMLCYVDSP